MRWFQGNNCGGFSILLAVSTFPLIPNKSRVNDSKSEIDCIGNPMDQRFPFPTLLWYFSVWLFRLSIHLSAFVWAAVGHFGAKAHFHGSLFLIRFFSMTLHCCRLSSALNCILSLFFTSSAQDSVFFSSSHLPVKPARPPTFPVRVLETRPGGFAVPNCQALIAFCCSGRHNSPASRGHLDRWPDWCSCQGSKSLFQRHQKGGLNNFNLNESELSRPCIAGFPPSHHRCRCFPARCPDYHPR